MGETTDGELVKATLGGAQESYRELVSRYQGHVYGLAYSLVGNWADAQDIAQETFIRAYSNLDQLRDPARFSAWLRRVTFGVAMNWLRSFRPGLFRQLDGRVDLDRLDIPDFKPGPPEVAERRELADAVLEAVTSLPPKYRVPLTMFHLDGLSYQKVADFLNIPLGTAKSIIHRAREKLRLALAPIVGEEITPMVQEVFDEHKLPSEFSREVWKLCMDWLCSVDEKNPVDPTPEKERAQRIASAASRDPEVAKVNEWRHQAEPVPEWALAVDKETPRWAIEICNHAWLDQLERCLWMIGNETALSDPPPGKCGSISASRWHWGAVAEEGLSRWLAGSPVSPEEPPPLPEIHSLLGPRDNEKVGAAHLLREALRLAIGLPRESDEEFDELAKKSGLPREIRHPIGYVQLSCGYRWEKVLLDACRFIGDRKHRQSKLDTFRVGACNGQLAFVYRDDPLRVPTTSAILVGLWSWLKDIPSETVEARYPTLAPLAERVRQQLAEITPPKRWLAGRLFVGIRIWLQELDHGDIKQPLPAVDPYPTLS